MSLHIVGSRVHIVHALHAVQIHVFTRWVRKKHRNTTSQRFFFFYFVFFSLKTIIIIIIIITWKCSGMIMFSLYYFSALFFFFRRNSLFLFVRSQKLLYCCRMFKHPFRSCRSEQCSFHTCVHIFLTKQKLYAKQIIFGFVTESVPTCINQKKNF